MAGFMVSLLEIPCPFSLSIMSFFLFFFSLRVFHFNSLFLITPLLPHLSFLMCTFPSVSFACSSFHSYLSSFISLFPSWYFPLSVGFRFFLSHFLSFLSLIFIFNIRFLSLFSLLSLFPNTHAVCSNPRCSSPLTTAQLRNTNPPVGCCRAVTLLAACHRNCFQL